MIHGSQRKYPCSSAETDFGYGRNPIPNVALLDDNASILLDGVGPSYVDH